MPNHHVKSIDGASYDGYFLLCLLFIEMPYLLLFRFYYICYQKSTDSITGYYYHRAHHGGEMYVSSKPKEIRIHRGANLYLGTSR